MTRRPSAITAKWFRLYQDDRVTIDVNENDSIHFKVVLDNRPKYFYNETVHSDVVRYLADETGEMKYWGALL